MKQREAEKLVLTHSMRAKFDLLNYGLLVQTPYYQGEAEEATRAP